MKTDIHQPIHIWHKNHCRYSVKNEQFQIIVLSLSHISQKETVAISVLLEARTTTAFRCMGKQLIK